MVVGHHLVLFTMFHTSLKNPVDGIILYTFFRQITNTGVQYRDKSWLKLCPNPQKCYELVE